MRTVVIVVASVVAALVAALLAAPQPAVAAACGPPGGPSRPAQGIAPPLSAGVEDTRIRWTRWPAAVTYGDAATLEGQVVEDDGAVPEATVELLARPAGSAQWAPVGTATADPETGVFSFGCLGPDRNTTYRAVYDGTLYYSPSRGDREVRVARRVPDALRQVSAHRFVLSGSVAPRYARRPVRLHRRDCRRCRWRAVDKVASTGRSRWRFEIDARTVSGRRWFRVVVPGDERFVRSHGVHVWRITRR